MAQAVYSLESLKMGATGSDGAMGATLANITKIAEDSLTFDFAEPTLTNIIAEEDDSPFAVLKKEGEKKVTFESLDLSLDNLKVIFGGSITTNKLTPGVSFSIPEQSLEIVTRPINGKKLKFGFPRCQVTGVISGSLSKTNLLKLKITASVLQPYNALGEKLADMTFEYL